jgi:hypothetical protein
MTAPTLFFLKRIIQIVFLSDRVAISPISLHGENKQSKNVIVYSVTDPPCDLLRYHHSTNHQTPPSQARLAHIFIWLFRVRACTTRRYTPSVYRHIFILAPAPACRRRPRRLAKGRLCPVPQPPADDEPTRCSSRLLQATTSGGSRVPALSPPPIPSRAPNPAASPAKTTRS